MPLCAIADCNNSHRKTRGCEIRYHRFPADSNMRSLWKSKCGGPVNNMSTARICSRHFGKECYERDITHEVLGLPIRYRLRKWAVPEKELGEECQNGEDVEVLRYVGLVPNNNGVKAKSCQEVLNKMQITVAARQAANVQPPPDDTPALEAPETPQTNGIEPAKPTDHETVLIEEEPEEQQLSPNHGVGEKRKLDEEPEDPLKKRLRSDLEQCYALRDKILNDYMENVPCTSVQQVETHIELIVTEIKALNELAREKEREWNAVIHQKKIKEELLVRIQRRKQLMWLDEHDCEPQPDILKNIKTGNGLMIYSTNKQKPAAAQPATYLELTNGKVNPSTQLQQRPVIDVQSIIADFRQRHPEVVPRRGRRIRTTIGDNQAPICTSNNAQTLEPSRIINFASVSLGSGAQVKHNPSVADGGGTDVTVVLSAEQTDILQPSGKLPPLYSEVTVHPIVPIPSQASPSNNASLLHGILTKTKPAEAGAKSAYSPTLAKLLTSPGGAGDLPANKAAGILINDMLASNTAKGRNEITITPIGGQFEVVKEKVNDDEIEDTTDRLVIDESETRNGTEETVDEVPQCQGCNQKPAQFVCAGCGNQWYCSRECQVVAWDEHSDVCSG